MLEAIVQIKINRVAWSKARLSWGAGLAPLRERARRSLVVDAGAADDVGDGDTKSGLEVQWTLVVIGGEDVGDGNTESGSAVHNAQIEQFDDSVYKIEPYMIQSHKIFLGINRVWDSGAYFEPNSMNTESYL